MGDLSALQVIVYLLGIFFIIAFAAKMLAYHRMPMHLRWEIYPLAGDTKHPWGGSYLEDAQWWEKPIEEKSLLSEMKFMGQEIFFFKEYFLNNRSLWYIIYPFHMGVFLFVVFFALLIAGAITVEAEIDVAGNSSSLWGETVYYATLITGVGGLCLGSAGCLGLLIRKMTDSSMSPYTRRIEYFNIILVLAILITGLLSWIIADSTFDTGRAFMNGMITFGETGSIDAIITVHILLLAIFLAYMPFTNIIHFFIKHFSYNSVRWDDSPHLPGSEVERRLQPQLAKRLNWSAPHIKGEGIAHWSDIPAKQAEQD